MEKINVCFFLISYVYVLLNNTEDKSYTSLYLTNIIIFKFTSVEAPKEGYIWFKGF